MEALFGGWCWHCTHKCFGWNTYPTDASRFSPEKRSCRQQRLPLLRSYLSGYGDWPQLHGAVPRRCQQKGRASPAPGRQYFLSNPHAPKRDLWTYKDTRIQLRCTCSILAWLVLATLLDWKIRSFTCMGIAENLLGFMVFCRGSLKLRYFLGIVLICSVWDWYLLMYIVCACDLKSYIAPCI